MAENEVKLTKLAKCFMDGMCGLHSTRTEVIHLLWMLSPVIAHT